MQNIYTIMAISDEMMEYFIDASEDKSAAVPVVGHLPLPETNPSTA